jgi:eukaryotic-like serine/threonine-protein kinase
LLDLKTMIGVGSSLLIVLGGGLYYWRLETSLNQTSETELFAEEQSQFPLVFDHKASGVSLTYSPDWRLSRPKQKSNTIARFAPEKADSFIIVPEVKIEVSPAKADSLDQHTTNFVYQITKLPQVKIIDSRPVEFAGKNGHKVIYTMVDPNNGLELKYLQAWTLRNNQIYTMTYHAAIDDYSDFVEVVEQDMFKSLQINLNNKPKVSSS